MLARISSESVREATGRDWDDWLRTLDEAGAADWSHPEIVAYLRREHGGATSAWWRQSLTVGYEQARGKRVAGETADAGFQVGVQRTVAATAAEAWDVIASRPDLWLGEGVVLPLAEGRRYEVADAAGEIRVVKPAKRLRLTWQPEGWAAPATLQLTLSEPRSGKTAVSAHLEKLPNAEAREAMRARWRETLERLTAAIAEGDAR
jgi:uncharacterized protein YndB with AHSA1/START domain